MQGSGFLATCVALCVLAGASMMPAGSVAQPSPTESFRPWTGDFNEMLERKLVRILVPLSPTLFFQDRGESYGATAELGRELEKWLNKRHGTESRTIRIVFIPTARTRLFEDLQAGRGDIVSANLTITPERAALVDFSRPWATGIKEVLVTGPSAPQLGAKADLADREIKVRKHSTYHRHLLAANESMVKEGARPIRIVLAEENVEDENLLEQVSAGRLPWTVVDSHIAKLWSGILTNLTVREDIVFHDNVEIGWAFRKNSPQLKAELDEFVQTVRRSGFSK